MDEAMQEKVAKRLKEGWLKNWMMIEVLAVSAEAARSALDGHVAKLAKEEKTLVYAKKFGEIKRVENPLPTVPVGYTHVAELDLLTQDYETLVMLVMNYAPSSVEILEPDKIRMDMAEAQGILNSLSETLHKFAAAGLGGVVIRS